MSGISSLFQEVHVHAPHPPFLCDGREEKVFLPMCKYAFCCALLHDLLKILYSLLQVTHLLICYGNQVNEGKLLVKVPKDIDTYTKYIELVLY